MTLVDQVLWEHYHELIGPVSHVCFVDTSRIAWSYLTSCLQLTSPVIRESFWELNC